MIKIGETAAKVYVGDMQPVNIYKGATKVAGWHSQTVSGTGTISLDGAYNVPSDALVVDGKSVQGSTTGKNLFAFPVGFSQTKDGITMTVQSDGIHLSGTPTIASGYIYFDSDIITVAAGTYTIKTDHKVAGIGFAAGVGSGALNLTMAETVAQRTAAVSSTYATSKQSINVRYDVGAINDTFRVQLELGSTATAYEPYTGGIPSPSPDYPQPITSITGDLTITGANGDLSDTATASLGAVEICSLPDGTKDEHDVVAGIVTKRCEKAVFDGSADELWTLQSINSYGIANFAMTPFNLAQTSGTISSVCDRFQRQFTYISSTTTEGYFQNLGPEIYFRVLSTRASNVAAFRTLLAANPVTVIYKLATPYTIQLTPDLPVVRTGIKTLTVSANITPTFTATVKAMD